MIDLKEVRKARGLTQGELAKMVGVKERMIRAYENGENLPPVGRLVPLARALGISVQAVLEATAELEALGVERMSWPHSEE